MGCSKRHLHLQVGVRQFDASRSSNTFEPLTGVVRLQQQLAERRAAVERRVALLQQCQVCGGVIGAASCRGGLTPPYAHSLQARGRSPSSHVGAGEGGCWAAPLDALGAGFRCTECPGPWKRPGARALCKVLQPSQWLTVLQAL